MGGSVSRGSLKQYNSNGLYTKGFKPFCVGVPRTRGRPLDVLLLTHTSCDRTLHRIARSGDRIRRYDSPMGYTRARDVLQPSLPGCILLRYKALPKDVKKSLKLFC